MLADSPADVELIDGRMMLVDSGRAAVRLVSRQPTHYEREGTTMDENETQAAAGYEFTVPQNAVIQKTATYAKVWGIFSIVLGAMQILMGLSGGGFLLAGIVSIVIGTVFIGVASSLKAVVVTEGNDIDHMMDALQKLGNAFLIQVVATVAAVVVAMFAA